MRYLVQCEAGLPELYECLRDRCTVLSFRHEHADTDLFLPDSTWTAGRNALHDHHRQAGLTEDYYVFLDADIQFRDLSQRAGFERFERALGSLDAPIVVPNMWNYNARRQGVPGIPRSIEKKGLQRKDLSTQPVDWFDGAFNAFRADVFEDERMLPYDDSFDQRSWWVSQFITILRANILHRARVIQLNELAVLNTQSDRSGAYLPGFDGFADAYEKVRQTFGLEEIEMTSEDALPRRAAADRPGPAVDRWKSPVIASGSERLTQPHLSIVVVGRNDGYGGDFLNRLRCCVAQLCAQLSVRSALVELVIVEWNPLPERPSLQACLEDLSPPPNFLINILTVPASVHQRLDGADQMPVFEYVGKNAGVRRASGRFVLSMNPDLILADELLDYICSDRLHTDGFYRADRHDFDATLDVSAAGAENLRAAEASIVSAITYSQQGRPREDVRRNGYTYTAASGDFWLAHASVWNRLKGYLEIPVSTHIDSLLCYEAVSKGVAQYVLPSAMRVFHMDHSREDRMNRPGINLGQWRERIEAGEFDDGRDDWGLAHEPLSLRTLGCEARSPSAPLEPV